MAKLDQPTVGRHSPYEAVSALQKAIRRGELDNAMYWAVDLTHSGHQWWTWKRLAVIASEDVGPAWMEGPAVIAALYSSWRTFKTDLFLYDAVVRLVRAPKSRIVDLMASVHGRAHEQLHREVPDEALDMHTQRGRENRRGYVHFYDEAAAVNNAAPDPDEENYRALAVQLALAGVRRPYEKAGKSTGPEDEVTA